VAADERSGGLGAVAPDAGMASLFGPSVRGDPVPGFRRLADEPRFRPPPLPPPVLALASPPLRDPLPPRLGVLLRLRLRLRFRFWLPEPPDPPDPEGRPDPEDPEAAPPLDAGRLPSAGPRPDGPAGPEGSVESLMVRAV